MDLDTGRAHEQSCRLSKNLVVGPDSKAGVLDHQWGVESGFGPERGGVLERSLTADTNDTNLTSVLLSKLLNIRALGPADASKRTPKPEQNRSAIAGELARHVYGVPACDIDDLN